MLPVLFLGRRQVCTEQGWLWWPFGSVTPVAKAAWVLGELSQPSTDPVWASLAADRGTWRETQVRFHPFVGGRAGDSW